MAESREKVLTDWANNVLHRILKEMETQQITPHNPNTMKRDYPNKGSLREGFTFGKDISYKIYNSAGGDAEKITFFYEYFSIFVETGVGGGKKYDSSKLGSPFNAGKQYFKPRYRGERVPKPFVTPIIKQAGFTLGVIANRALGQEIAAKIITEFSALDDIKREKRSQQAQTSFWKKYARAKGR